MEVQALYRLASQQNIGIYRFPMAENGSMSVMDEDGSCYVGMDEGICDNGVRERVHLAHELGHCVTGSFYNRYTPYECRKRQENKADKWAVKTLIPVQALDDAVAMGCTELWELAEHFGVTESFMKKAVCLYVHGNMAQELYF